MTDTSNARVFAYKTLTIFQAVAVCQEGSSPIHKKYRRLRAMTKTNKLLFAGAALAGLLAGTASVQASNLLGKTTQDDAKADKKAKDKHTCKGQNSCKGKGGCKSSDNGCKGKNSCKGKGGCRTDGKPMDEKPS
jgi:hypothetical protein